MGCDMVVALGHATVDGQTLFGLNSDHVIPSERLLCRAPGREFAPGEKVRTQFAVIPEARQTCTVLALQPDGWWGYSHGANEHGVTIGSAVLRTMLQCPEPGLTGGDLVRLALERSHTAQQAVDCLTALIERHGQSASPGQCGPYGTDHAFLIADAAEAFAVETAGRHWVYQEMHEVRALGNASVIHQDWDRISHGLAGNAIDRGWWPSDGSKLDFAYTLSRDPVGQASGLRRWGRATSLLEQQNGHIDLGFLRRLLSDHYEGTHYEVEPYCPTHGPVPLCQHGNVPDGSLTRSSFVAQLSADASHLPVYWWGFGPPCLSAYVPVFFEGELPAALTAEAVGQRDLGTRLARLHETVHDVPRRRQRLREALDHLQARFDREVEEFAVEGARVKREGDQKKLGYLSGAFMQQAVERFELVLDDLELAVREPAAIPTWGSLASDW